jgi:hypothetical protein
MKFSAAAAASLLLAVTATVEASSVHDSPLQKRHHDVPRNSNYGTIKPADHGHCNPIGATSLFNWSFVNHCDMLTIVVCMQRKSQRRVDPMAILTG